MHRIYLLFLILFFSCENNTKAPSLSSTTNKDQVLEKVDRPQLTLDEANRLSRFAFNCIDKEYPNKLGQVLGDASYLNTPKELHPMFYGCFDWHSAVHGHWTLVKLMKQFPELKDKDLIKAKLNTHFTPENIAKEMAYFDDKHNKNYERTYGWAWLLKLCEELHTWQDTDAQRWSNMMKPYAKLISQKYLDFLPKLNYPIRVGEHSNTAFGLTFAWDYANEVGDVALKDLIENRAKAYYLNDKDCPATWEPSGFDFLSPCLEEADIMSRVLNPEEFEKWMTDFLPDLTNKFQPAEVTDRSDGKLVHLDGLNFSRAWCLYGLAKNGGNQSEKFENLGNLHLAKSPQKIQSGDYAGEHWLASFAVYALTR